MKKTLLFAFIIFTQIFSNSTSQAQVLLTEDFSAGTLPSGWSNDSLGLPARHLWIFNNAFNRLITGAGFDGHFAIFDSDEASHNDGFDENASLTTTEMDLTTASATLFLEMDQQFNPLGGPNTSGSSRRIEYSVDSGLNWTTIVYDSVGIGYPNPAVHSTYDVSSVLGLATHMRFRFTYTGSYDWWWAIDNIRVISRQLCFAPPVAGTTISNLLNVCPTDSFNLTLSGNDIGIGIQYQWQNSSDNSTWNDLAGDTAELLRSAQGTNMYYRCALTCSGQTSYSTSIGITMNPPTGCYCVPQFTNGCEVLNKVLIGTLNNDSSGCNGNLYFYVQYPDTGRYTTDLQQGMPYSFTIASGTAISGLHGAAVWFDFNQNGSLHDIGEYFHISDSINPNSPNITRTIIIPPFALTGHTRMRVRLIYATNVVSTNDCTSHTFGETEDYTVNIILPVGINEHALQSVEIYPSITSGIVSVKLGDIKGTSVITVVDLLGNVLMKDLIQDQTSFPLNLEGFSRGIYFIRINHGTETITEKVILNK